MLNGRLTSIQSLVLYSALSAYFGIIKNERHGVHVTQLMMIGCR